MSNSLTGKIASRDSCLSFKMNLLTVEFRIAGSVDRNSVAVVNVFIAVGFNKFSAQSKKACQCRNTRTGKN